MKIPIGPKPLMYPLPALLVGTYDQNDNPNLMTASWAGIVSSNPPCINVSIRKDRYTHTAITKNKEYSISIPSEKNIEVVDYCGIYSGADVNKFEVLNIKHTKSDIIRAPILTDFPITMLCRLKRTLAMGSHTMFIGEILDIYAESEVTGLKNILLMDRIKPILYDTVSKTYYSVGEPLMKAYTTKKG